MATGIDTENRPIVGKVFTDHHQRLFASASLDCNPMHMDPIAARRLINGRCVVHGIHTLLSAIECWRNDDRAIPRIISCSFDNAISVGEKVTFAQHDHAGGTFIQAIVDGVLCAQVTITTGGMEAPVSLKSSLTLDPHNMCSGFDRLSSPLDEPPDFHSCKSYVINPNDADMSAEFPRAYRYLGQDCFTAICSLSYFVGMVCPGLHSIFSSVSFELVHERGVMCPLIFSVESYDNRARFFDVSFRGRIRGNLRAFSRPPSQEQPSLKEFCAHVTPGEFRGTRSLVVGGSRGLGEVVAKMLAAGGGDVIITYSTGEADAQKIKREIDEAGFSACELMKLDVTADSRTIKNLDCNTLDAVYFFATPRIARKKRGIFSPSLFEEFCEFYVKAFYHLCLYLEANVVSKKIKVYFPSTVFVSERPVGMAEYAMAKAAGEVLIQEINKSFERVSVISTRLPRLATDQTSSLVRKSTESNLATLLPVVRSLSH